MSLCTIHFRSAGLGCDTNMNVIVPDVGTGPFPVVVLLHGLSGSYNSYSRMLRIEELLYNKPVIAVMPDGGRTFYANDVRPGGLRGEEHIVQDVLGYVERVFPVRKERAGRAVIGLSMGGYGALLLGLRHANTFSVACSLSGSTYFAHEPSERHQDDDIGYLNAALPHEANDLFCLAAAHARSGPEVAIRQSCGTEDFLWATNLAFHQHLTQLGIAHEWAPHPGQHDQLTWTTQLPLALDFALTRLGSA